LRAPLTPPPTPGPPAPLEEQMEQPAPRNMFDERAQVMIFYLFFVFN
jgi:hypothetical protein